jgi:hypothetical protein
MDEEVTVQMIEKIKEFMFADLDKTIALVNLSSGAPSFISPRVWHKNKPT